MDGSLERDSFLDDGVKVATVKSVNCAANGPVLDQMSTFFDETSCEEHVLACTETR